MLIDGAKVKSWATRRGGFLSNDLRLTLTTTDERRVYRNDLSTELIDALGGSKRSVKPMERGVGVVGVRRDDTLALRLLDLDSGKVRCEGVTAVAKTRADSQYEEDAALSNAVMRPFCKQMPEGSCVPQEPEPVAPTPEVAPKPTPTKQPKTPGNTQLPALNAVAPDRAGIQAAMRAITPNTRACYERALAKRPSLQGTLNMRFVIGTNGQVTSVSGSGFPTPRSRSAWRRRSRYCASRRAVPQRP